MITPPNGSAEDSGMNPIVSSAPRHKNAFTPIPLPPPPLAWSLRTPLPMPKIGPLSSPPTRVPDMSPGEPLPNPWKFGGVGFGLSSLDEQPATANAATRAVDVIQALNGRARMRGFC